MKMEQKLHNLQYSETCKKTCEDKYFSHVREDWYYIKSDAVILSARINEMLGMKKKRFKTKSCYSVAEEGRFIPKGGQWDKQQALQAPRNDILKPLHNKLEAGSSSQLC